MINYLKRYKNQVINFSIKKAYSYFFLNDFKSTGYYAHLKNLIFEFLQSKYPNYKKELFEKRIKSLILNYDEYKDLNYALNNLFNPNYNDNLQDHYKNIEKNIFFKFILNSLNTKLIRNKYSEIYDFSINEINEPLNILEIGGGLPHGFIYNIWRKEKLFFKNFNYIDADLLHTEFVKWYCHKLKIPSEIEIFPASITPTIKNNNYNFVFAKDVFEHLDDPEKLIDNLIENTKNNKTLLCLDLEHKGEKTTQHLNPNLPLLKNKLIDNKFKVIKKFEEVHIWKKII